MKATCLHDKAEIECRLRREASLHLYELGDLDEFFWPHTTWYALKDDPASPVILLYSGQRIPTLLALETMHVARMRELIGAVLHLLPAEVYAHLSDGLMDSLQQDYDLASHGLHLKYVLKDRAALDRFSSPRVVPLAPKDLPELLDFYRRSHERNWFDPRMLETGCYFGIRMNSRLAVAAGIHVYSPRYRIAVLGNVATDPEFRGKGLATEACAHLCRHLLKHVDLIGLNVKADNAPARACYEKLGFEVAASYFEAMLRKKL